MVSFCPVLLMTRNTFAHLIIPGLRGSNHHGVVVRRLSQPLLRQQLGAARLAASLAAEDQFAARYHEEFSHELRPNLQ